MRIFTEPSFLIIQPLSGNAFELNFVHQCLIMHRFLQNMSSYIHNLRNLLEVLQVLLQFGYKLT